MNFDTDTTSMSRGDLEANYLAAVQALEALGFGGDRFAEQASRVLKLTQGQIRILAALMPGRFLRSDRLLLAAYGDRAGYVEENTVRVHISTLRKALAPQGIEIETRHGLGYGLAAKTIEDIRLRLGLTEADT